MTHLERSWPTMGVLAELWLTGERPAADLERIGQTVRAEVERVATTLTRFEPASELCRLNADPRPVVPASPTMQRFVLAVRRAGVLSGGLVDATRLDDVEGAGYRTSRPADAPVPALDAVLAAAPPRRPASPHPDQAYRDLEVHVGAIRRPPGLRLDSGGIGKGLAADLAARRVPADVSFAIAVGGDLALGGPVPPVVDVVRADGTGVAHRLRPAGGGVATSAIHRRLWTNADGPAHHLIDPSTGRPAWTGLVAVTAVGADGVEAEALAKTALLAGPHGARRWLRRRGGVLQAENGRVEVLEPAPVVRLRAAA